MRWTLRIHEGMTWRRNGACGSRTRSGESTRPSPPIYVGNGLSGDEAVTRPEVRASFLVSLREDAVAKLDRFKARIPPHLHEEFAPFNERPPVTSEDLLLRRPTFRWLHSSAVVRERPAFQTFEKTQPGGDLTSYLRSHPRTSSS